MNRWATQPERCPECATALQALANPPRGEQAEIQVVAAAEATLREHPNHDDDPEPDGEGAW